GELFFVVRAGADSVRKQTGACEVNDEMLKLDACQTCVAGFGLFEQPVEIMRAVHAHGDGPFCFMEVVRRTAGQIRYDDRRGRLATDKTEIGAQLWCETSSADLILRHRARGQRALVFMRPESRQCSQMWRGMRASRHLYVKRAVHTRQEFFSPTLNC